MLVDNVKNTFKQDVGSAPNQVQAAGSAIKAAHRQLESMYGGLILQSGIEESQWPREGYDGRGAGDVRR